MLLSMHRAFKIQSEFQIQMNGGDELSASKLIINFLL